MSGYHYVNISKPEEIPRTAIVGGVDKDGGRIYVGRAHHCGELLPAKIIPNHRVAYVSFAGKEYPKHQFEVLCEKKMQWVSSSHGRIPNNAVQCGKTSRGESLYVGRTPHDGTLTVGKVHPSHGCLYIAYNGNEIRYEHYEVLVTV